MKEVEAGADTRTRSDRLCDLLDRVDYRVATTTSEREAIFRLRHDAYSRDGGIAERADRRLTDGYDDLPNTILFGLYIDGALATTVRVSVVTSAFTSCPAMEVFPDLLEGELAAGKVLIDPTRHASDEAFSTAYPMLLPYMTIRLPWMVGEYFSADLIVATVRAEHRAFYRRTFGCRPVGEPRLYPSLLKPHHLMFGDYPRVRDDVHRRYPSFRSSAFERRTLLESTAAARAVLATRDEPRLRVAPECESRG